MRFCEMGRRLSSGVVRMAGLIGARQAVGSDSSAIPAAWSQLKVSFVSAFGNRAVRVGKPSGCGPLCATGLVPGSFCVRCSRSSVSAYRSLGCSICGFDPPVLVLHFFRLFEALSTAAASREWATKLVEEKGRLWANPSFLVGFGQSVSACPASLLMRRTVFRHG